MICIIMIIYTIQMHIGMLVYLKEKIEKQGNSLLNLDWQSRKPTYQVICK